jgi:general secretion pathway protein K
MSAIEQYKKRKARRRRQRRDKRGVALIMVLGAITVLTVFLTEIQEETAAELSSAIAERDALKAEYIAKSAVNLSRLLIMSQDTILGSLRSIPMLGSMIPPQVPIWQAADVALGIFNDEAGVAAFGGFLGADLTTGKNMGLSGGRFDLKIIDEDGLLNINKGARIGAPQVQLAAFLTALMQGEQYNPIFEGRDADNQFSDRTAVCSEVIDWVDWELNGSGEGIFGCDTAAAATNSSKGPEDNFYQNIGMDYVRKNAPFDSLEELRLLRGFGSDVFWSTFVEPDPNDPSSRLMTVWGQNAININTAHPLNLLVLACSNTTPGTEPLCTDPAHQLAFLERAMFLRSLLPPAIPLFTKKQDFISLMSSAPATGGRGNTAANAFSLMPMISAQLFDTPPAIPKITKFNRTNNEISSQITVKSERFSVYAEGVIPGYRRETRVRVHAVIDTRPLPPTPTSGTFGGASAGSSIAGQPGVLEDPLRKAPGNLLYYRVE